MNLRDGHFAASFRKSLLPPTAFLHAIIVFPQGRKIRPAFIADWIVIFQSTRFSACRMRRKRIPPTYSIVRIFPGLIIRQQRIRRFYRIAIARAAFLNPTKRRKVSLGAYLFRLRSLSHLRTHSLWCFFVFVAIFRTMNQSPSLTGRAAVKGQFVSGSGSPREINHQRFYRCNFLRAPSRIASAHENLDYRVFVDGIFTQGGWRFLPCYLC